MSFTRRASLLLGLLVSSAVGVRAGRPLFPEPLVTGPDDPLGVAVADFDHDGHLDLVVTGRTDDEIRVHLGHGDGSFTRLPDQYSDDCPDYVLAEDFDADGNADLAVAKFCSGGISILMGHGDGTFAPEVDYGSGAQLFTLARADFNGDGVLDLVGIGGDALVLLGDGQGGFATHAAPGQPYFVGIADFDGDGLDDYAYPTNGGPGVPGKVTIELSDGDGTFTTAGSFPVGVDPNGVAAGDLDGDMVPDLVVANGESDDISVLLGLGDGTFGPEQRYTLGPQNVWLEPWGVMIDDRDGDGLPDVIVTNWGAVYPDASVALFRGTGGGNLAAAVALDVMPGSTHEFLLADLDEDGHEDLVRTSMWEAFVKWRLGDGQGGFVANRVEGVGTDPRSIAVVDLDGDGRLDLAVANQGSDDVSALLASGAGTFAPEIRSCVVSAAPPCPAGSDPSALAAGELTGDAHPDLAVANAASNTISILAGDGAGHFTLVATLGLPPGTSLSSVALGNLDGSGGLDLAAVGKGSGRLRVFLGSGDGTFGVPPGFPPIVGDQPVAVALGDLDGDADLDAAVANAGSDDVTILLGAGNGTFAFAPSVAAGAEPAALALGDLDGDAILDLAVANAAAETVQAQLGNGDGTFGVPTVLSTDDYGGPASVLIADLDGDGLRDLAATTHHQWVWPGHGDGTFGAAQTYETVAAQLAAGDFNLDSRLDLVSAGGWLDAVTILLNQSGPRTLAFEADRATLVWPAVNGATTYNIYRGQLSELVDGNDDGLPDTGYGVCQTGLDLDPRDTFFVDAELPAAGAGFYYLMSVVSGGVDGGLGVTSAGLPRQPLLPCP